MTVSRGISISVSDDQLVARCRAGDLDAFAQVYAQYEQQVYRYAYHLLGHREDADDTKQETFVRAYQAIGSFRCDASLRTWLLSICGNLCRDKIKSWNRRHVMLDLSSHEEYLSSQNPSMDPFTVVQRTEVTDTIHRALRAMPPAQREIIVLHDIEDLSYDEIAGILGCARTSAKLRLFRARRSLKERVTALLRIRD